MKNIKLESQMPETFDILGVRIAASTIPLACEVIAETITQQKRGYICIAPVSTIVDCQKDPAYLKVINSSLMTTPDGMPVVWLGRLHGCHVERTYGPDLLQAFCALSEEKGYRHFFYGGTNDSNALLISKLKKIFPTLNIVGTVSPDFLKVGELEEDAIIDIINQANADILWIGLGSPKQDYWMSNHRPLLNVPVMVGVGAAFDFISGVKKQAPYWMQRGGLEWVFRLCSEPRRLWRRYLIGNTQFIFYLIRNAFKRS